MHSSKMELQSVYQGLPALKSGLSTHRSMSHVSSAQVGLRHQRIEFGIVLKSPLMMPSVACKKRGAILCACDVPPPASHESEENDPSHDKTYLIPLDELLRQLVREERWEALATTFRNEYKGSCLWVLSSLAFISSSIFPRLLISRAMKAFLTDSFLLTIGTSISMEAPFYIGLAIFLRVTENVLQPYLEFMKPKEAGDMTGLRGYLKSGFVTLAVQLIVPLFALRLAWELLDPPARVALVSLVLNCVAQLAFETTLWKRGWSSWAFAPIIFEVYRLHQLTETEGLISLTKQPTGLGFIKLFISNINMPLLFGMKAILRLLGVVCLWSLIAFLTRIFISSVEPV